MGRTWRLAAKLLSSSIIAQLAVMGALLLAAKRATPADIADYGAVFSWASVLASFNTLAAETRVPVVGEGQAPRLTSAGFSIATVFSVAIALGAAVTAFFDRGLALHLLFVATGSFLLGLNQLLIGSIIRQQRQQLLARSRIVQGISNAALIVSLIYTSMAPSTVLSLAWIVSVGLGDLALVLGGRTSVRDLRWTGLADWRLLASEVRMQPVSNVILTVVGSLPLMVLPLFSKPLAGAWALVSRFLTPVVNTLFSALQPLYEGQAAELVRRCDVSGFQVFHGRWVRRLLALGGLSALAFAGVVAWGIPLLGPSWSTAGVLVPGVVSYAALVACLPMSRTLVLVGKVNVQFGWAVSRVVLCALPFAMIGWLGPTTALLLWALLQAATFFAQFTLHRIAARGMCGPPTPSAAEGAEWLER